MDNKKIKEKLSEGYLHIRAIIEIVGKPKKYVEDTINDYLKKIKEDYDIVNEHLETTEPQDDLFSAFAELEIMMKNSNALLSFCFDFMPSSIEILEPEQINVKNTDLSSFLNDLQTRVHGLNTGLLQEKQQSKFYIKNTAVLLRNFLVVLLSSRAMSLKEIQPFLGVKENDIEKVLQVLINEKKVIKQGDKFQVIK